MKLKTLSVIPFVAVCVCAFQLRAQETNSMHQFQQRLDAMQANFERTLAAQRAEIDSLKQEVAVMRAAPPRPLLAETPSVTGSAPAPAIESKPWSPADPIRVGKGAAYVDVGLVATFAAGGSTAKDFESLQLGGHDPNQRGFTVQGVELNLEGAVDPYFRGNASVLFALDAGGETFVELEEAWLETVTLPGNFSIRAGQFLSDFGRINTQHPHAWSFVDVPLVSARLLGPDGLRNPGARLAWLAPTPFFTELSLGVQNSHGETAASFRSAGHSHGGGAEEGAPFGFRHPDNDRGVRGFGDLLFTPRLATSFELTEAQTLVLGASAAFGPNSSGAGGDNRTQIYGVDAYWKWKPANAHGGFPFVSWQTEAMLRRYQLGAFDWDENGDGLADAGEVVDPGTGLPAVLARETVTDYGFYSQLLYGFKKGWVAGLRFDYVGGSTADYETLGFTQDGNPLGRDPLRGERWRISPNLTWYPSDFTKLRLQYNYDDRARIGQDHSVWLQFEFMLGSHNAPPERKGAHRHSEHCEH